MSQNRPRAPLLRRSRRCDAMALQNRLIRQKFFTDIGKAYVTDSKWNNSNSKLYARSRGMGGGGEIGSPCVTPVWNRQSRQQVGSRLWRERSALRSLRFRSGR